MVLAPVARAPGQIVINHMRRCVRWSQRVDAVMQGAYPLGGGTGCFKPPGPVEQAIGSAWSGLIGGFVC